MPFWGNYSGQLRSRLGDRCKGPTASRREPIIKPTTTETLFLLFFSISLSSKNTIRITGRGRTTLLGSYIRTSKRGNTQLMNKRLTCQTLELNWRTRLTDRTENCIQNCENSIRTLSRLCQDWRLPAVAENIYAYYATRKYSQSPGVGHEASGPQTVGASGEEG